MSPIIPGTATTPHPCLLRWLRASAREVAVFEPPDDAAAWSAILREAERYGLLPLLHAAVDGVGSRLLPEDVRATLRDAARQVAARNLLLGSELAGILQAAQARGITCIPVRGVALAEHLYGNRALRPTGDIDVLVRREELAGVRALLAQRGFVEVEARPGFAETFDYTLTFFKQGGLLIVEPHWTIGYPPFGDRIDMAGVWARCVPGTAVGVPALLLGLEDLLLHLCLHALHHGEAAPLLWHHELDRCLRTQPLDWDLFGSLVTQARCAPLVLPVLRDSIRLFETPVPPSLLAAFEATPPSTGSERALIQLLTASPGLKGRERLAVWWGLRGVRAKLRYLLAFLFPSAAFIRAQYGVTTAWQVMRTYAWRLCAFAWRGVSVLWRRCELFVNY